jgi:hypothetical protein
MEMGQRLDRFLAGSPKPLRLAFLGFVIAALGATLGFSIDYGPGIPLAYVAFGIVLIGIVIGFIGVASMWYTVIFKPPGRDH